MSTDSYDFRLTSLTAGRGIKVSLADSETILRKLRSKIFRDRDLDELILKLLVQLGYDPYDQSPPFSRSDFESLNTGIPYESFAAECIKADIASEKITSSSMYTEMRKRVLREMLSQK